MIHQKLSNAILTKDLALEIANYQQINNHLIKSMEAIQSQMGKVTVSLMIVSIKAC